MLKGHELGVHGGNMDITTVVCLKRAWPVVWWEKRYYHGGF